MFACVIADILETYAASTTLTPPAQMRSLTPRHRVFRPAFHCCVPSRVPRALGCAEWTL